MHLLSNVTKAYEWGSLAAIPSFLRRAANGNPVAELWMGTHPQAPSSVEEAVGRLTPLVAVSGDLPFLPKVLEHQRATSPVLPQKHRSVTVRPRLLRARRPQTQSSPPQETQIQNPRRSTRQATVRTIQSKRCCIDRMNPPCHSGLQRGDQVNDQVCAVEGDDDGRH